MAYSIIDGTAKKRSRAIYMRFYWVRDRIRQNHFHIFWEKVNKNIEDYVTKYHPIWHQRTMRPKYVKVTKKDIKYSKDQQTGTGRGFVGTNNPGRTQKPDNPLKGIWNPIPQNTDNPLK